MTVSQRDGKNDTNGAKNWGSAGGRAGPIIEYKPTKTELSGDQGRPKIPILAHYAQYAPYPISVTPPAGPPQPQLPNVHFLLTKLGYLAYGASPRFLRAQYTSIYYLLGTQL